MSAQAYPLHWPTMRERRERQGLTQGQLGALAGVLGGYVSSIERGKATPAGTFEKVRSVLAKRERWERCQRGAALLQARVDQAWATAPDCDLVRLIRRQLVGRAWHLIEAGNTECADRLLELLPDSDRTQLLDSFFETEEWYPAALLTGAARDQALREVGG